MAREEQALTEYQDDQTVIQSSLWNMPPLPLVAELPVHLCLAYSWIED